jgi:coenzyme F420-reducing hydrogenase gamma subunit
MSNSQSKKEQEKFFSEVKDMLEKTEAVIGIGTALTGGLINPTEQVDLTEQLQQHYEYQQEQKREEIDKDLETSNAVANEAEISGSSNSDSSNEIEEELEQEMNWDEIIEANNAETKPEDLIESESNLNEGETLEIESENSESSESEENQEHESYRG